MRFFPQQAQRFVAAAIGLSVPATAARAMDDWPRVPVTAAEVQAANEKAKATYDALVTMWTNELRAIGAEFKAPKFVRYRDPVLSQCGVVPPFNAIYCIDDNTVYYDDAFLATEAKITARALGTDGDMAAVGIIAHEMGHAVAMQLGVVSRESYENESIADCLAGAYARRSQASGSLREGDLDEAFQAISAAADQEVQARGNGRRGGRRGVRVARDPHGTPEQRVRNFKNGLAGGGAACLEKLRPQGETP